MVATSAPTMALKSEDLPLPVAPASATTVWSPPIPERSTALSTTLRATATPEGSSSSAPDTSAIDSSVVRVPSSAAETARTVARPILIGLIARP